MNNQVAIVRQQDVGSFLEKNKAAIINALPKHVTADRLLRVALTEIRRNEKLKQCTPITLLGSIVQCAQLGIMPDSLTGQAYLVPYKNKQGKYECQLQIGYKGLMNLAYQSGQVFNIFASEVYNDDLFEFEYGLDPKLKHIPNFNGERNPQDLKCFYAIAYLKNGGAQFVVMTKGEIENHKKHSKTNNSQYSPWVTAFAEMAKKTAIRVLCKYLPQNTENLNLYKAISLDEQTDMGTQDNTLCFDSIDMSSADEAVEPKTKADEVVQRIVAQKSTKQPQITNSEDSFLSEESDKSLEELFGETTSAEVNHEFVR